VTNDVYAISFAKTGNLTLDSQGTGWGGYKVNRGSTSGSVCVTTRPRVGIEVEDAHSEYMSEYAHAYGFPVMPPVVKTRI
jgi:hypothetical protein